jgi:hypothetical protein
LRIICRGRRQRRGLGLTLVLVLIAGHGGVGRRVSWPGRGGLRTALAGQEKLFIAPASTVLMSMCVSGALIKECRIVAIVETRPPRKMTSLTLRRACDGILSRWDMAVKPRVIPSKRHGALRYRRRFSERWANFPSGVLDRRRLAGRLTPGSDVVSDHARPTRRRVASSST